MGDPLAAYVTERTTDEQYEMLAEKHGINEPIYVQYFTYLKSVITFDWGYSEVLNEDVSDALRYRFAATLELSILAFIFAVAYKPNPSIGDFLIVKFLGKGLYINLKPHLEKHTCGQKLRLQLYM